MMTLLAGVFASIGMIFGGWFGGHVSTASTTPDQNMHMRTASSSMMRPGGMEGGMASSTMHMRTAPGILGKVDSISGTTLMVTGRDQMGDATSTYSVDASSAKFMNLHDGTASSTTSSIANVQTGETVLVVGTISGTKVMAKTVVSGIPLHPIARMIEEGKGMQGMKGMRPGHFASTTAGN